MQAELCTPRGIGTGLLVVALVLSPVSGLSLPLQAPSTSPPSIDTEPLAACPNDDGLAADAGGTPAAVGHVRAFLSADLLSLDIQNCTLAQVLDAIASRVGIRITLAASIPASRLSLRLPARPIDATVRDLLRGMDVFVLYAAAPTSQSKVTAVWAYPRGAARDVEPVPAQLWASTRELQRQLADSDPGQRALAIEALVARNGAAALPEVMAALADGHADTRQRALDAALVAGLELPLPDLHALTLNDASPEVRLRALQALEELPDSAAIIELATHDRDENVQREAKSMLVRLRQTPP